jgi:hypothetical protein
MYKVLVTGDRNWTNYERIYSILSQLAATYGKYTVIAGECKGVDLLAKGIAQQLGLNYIGYPANWELYGKSAGPLRNKQMLEQKPHIILAFHNNIDSSRGTKHMLNIAKDYTRYLITDTSMTEYK